MRQCFAVILVLYAILDSTLSCCPRYWNGGCEPGYCYRFFHEPKVSWQEAEDNCITEGGHLVSITSAEENQFVLDLWRVNRRYQTLIWIGLSDQGDGFTWIDGSDIESYQNWEAGQPDESDQCGVMFLGDNELDIGKWYDLPCRFRRSYICKKPMAGN